MIGERGFEPPPPWSRTRCSTRLSHSPIGVAVDLPAGCPGDRVRGVWQALVSVAESGAWQRAASADPMRGCGGGNRDDAGAVAGLVVASETG